MTELVHQRQRKGRERYVDEARRKCGTCVHEVIYRQHQRAKNTHSASIGHRDSHLKRTDRPVHSRSAMPAVSPGKRMPTESGHQVVPLAVGKWPVSPADGFVERRGAGIPPEQPPIDEVHADTEVEIGDGVPGVL
jgi:hypothetical protein